MTQEELEKQIERAVEGFSALEGVDEDLANLLVGEGFLSYDDLEVIEPDFLMNLGGLTLEQVDAIVVQAEVRALEAEKVQQQQRRQKREQKERDAQGSPCRRRTGKGGCQGSQGGCRSCQGRSCQGGSCSPGRRFKRGDFEYRSRLDIRSRCEIG